MQPPLQRTLHNVSDRDDNPLQQMHFIYRVNQREVIIISHEDNGMARTKSETVLVTGGAGFIGSHLIDRLIADGYRIRILDNLSTGKLRNIQTHVGAKGFQFIKGDIRDLSTVRKALRKVHVVFHEAAHVSVTDSFTNPTRTSEVNTTGTLTLLQASVEYGVKRLIYSSSASIYGDQGEQRVKEDSTLRPMSPYAVSKLAAENYCSIFNKLNKLETVSLRYFNVYGPRQSVNQYAGVITLFQDRVRRNKSPIIYGDGKQTRDFVHVLDVVKANMLAMNAKKAAGEIFNIGTGHRTSILALAKMIIQSSKNKHLRPIHLRARSGDIKHSCADIAKARTYLGYSPRITLRDYLAELTQRGV
jgi:nucleoside-diphosphate-sugar epimerase